MFQVSANICSRCMNLFSFFAIISIVKFSCNVCMYVYVCVYIYTYIYIYIYIYINKFPHHLRVFSQHIKIVYIVFSVPDRLKIKGKPSCLPFAQLRFSIK